MKIYSAFVTIAFIQVFPTIIQCQEETSSDSSKCDSETIKKKLMDPEQRDCLKANFNFSALQIELEEAFQHNTLGDFIDKHCPKWKRFQKCATAYHKDMIDCIEDKDQKQTYQSTRNVMDAAIDYLCDNSGMRVMDLFRDGGVHCIIQQHESLKQCFTMEDGSPMIEATNLDEWGVPAINIVPKFYDAFECNLYHNLSDCVHKCLARCESNIAQKFFDHLMIAMLQETPCWNVLNAMETGDMEYIFMLSLLPKMVPTRARKCPDGKTGYENAKEQMEIGIECWNNNFNTGDFIEKVSEPETRKAKEFVALLKDYCPKLKQVDNCISNFMDSFIPCANDTEKVVINSTKRAIQTALGFICHRDGERVLLFLKENGPDCYKDKQEELTECVDKLGKFDINLSADLNMDFQSLANHNFWSPQSYDEEECRVINGLNECLYKILRKCKDRSPANLISSLIRSMTKQTPCWSFASQSSTSSSFLILLATSLSLFLTFTLWKT